MPPPPGGLRGVLSAFRSVWNASIPLTLDTASDALLPLPGAGADQRIARWGTELRRALGGGRRMMAGMMGAGVARRAASRRSCEARRAAGEMGSLLVMRQSSHCPGVGVKASAEKSWGDFNLDITAEVCASRKKLFELS
jgi:hypothetical protein